MNKEYLEQKAVKLREAIAWNVSSPTMLEYQKQMLIRIESKLEVLHKNAGIIKRKVEQ